MIKPVIITIFLGGITFISTCSISLVDQMNISVWSAFAGVASVLSVLLVTGLLHYVWPEYIKQILYLGGVWLWIAVLLVQRS